MEKNEKKKIPKDLKSLCVYCFHVLESSLNDKETTMEFPKEFKNITCPLFVTWTIGKEQDLRGCIGTFADSDLETNVPKYALISALKDSRFDPISKSELVDLHVAVSLLTDFEKGDNAEDWEVGKHGIQIYYKKYSATFLPEVASEQGWDKTTTLKQLLRKSGCRESLEEAMKNIQLERYQSKKESLSYIKYEKLKKDYGI